MTWATAWSDAGVLGAPGLTCSWITEFEPTTNAVSENRPSRILCEEVLGILGIGTRALALAAAIPGAVAVD